ncbi:MAG: nuclear transport factor 2 family protein [Sneathiellales bacterium]|nr:nuclear transport factor 2 family protein [Sneathiellales bacterium]
MTKILKSQKQELELSLTERCRRTAADMVSAFAVQDIDRIMEHFSEKSVYCDVLGDGQRGNEYTGKTDIRAAFEAGFQILGKHTYEPLSVVAEGKTAFASWVLIMTAADGQVTRLDGIDHFEMDENARITLKKGWLKGLEKLVAA